MGSSRPRLVVSGDSDEAANEFYRIMGDNVEVVRPSAPDAGTADGFLLTGTFAKRTQDVQLCAQGFLDSVSDALVLVDADDKVVWHNRMFQSMADSEQALIGLSFWEALGNPEILSPAVLPIPMSIDPGPDKVLKSILKMAERKFVAVRASRSIQPDGHDETRPFTTIVVRDVSEEILENQKREALYRAGIELGDLSPDEVTEMLHHERSELLKQKILDYSQEILGFETIEIRVLNPETNELLPLLEVGMQAEASTRRLYAEAEGNGVTGRVAATRISHLCQDTHTDQFYLSGAADARSSLTVPLIMHDVVLGTFNVERADVFESKDLEFLELFGCVVAMSLNQLQLLVAEKVTTATASSDQLRREIALPTDDILSSATAILEKYIGHDPDVCEKLQSILDNTRKIRSEVDLLSENVDAGDTAFLSATARTRVERPGLKGKRILVVDSDVSVLKTAHELLERHSCTVEAVRTGHEACQMARSHHYDVVLTDISLPDMTGYECFCKILEIEDRLPVILMTGFGYDAGHSIVKSRQRGLKSVLYKPFRREQLLTEVEKAVTTPPPHE